MPRKFKCALCKYRKCFDSVNSIEISIEAVNICRYKCLFAYMRHVLFCWLSIGTFSAFVFWIIYPVGMFLSSCLMLYLAFSIFSMVLFYRHASANSIFIQLPSKTPTYRSFFDPLRSYSMYFSIQWVCYCFICAFMGLFSFFFLGACIPKLLLNFNAMWSIVMILTENCIETPWSKYTSSRNATKIE